MIKAEKKWNEVEAFPEPARISTDREFIVPEGAIVETGYVHLNNIQFELDGRMSMEAVEKAYRKHLQLGGQSSWPPPYGKWTGDGFRIIDGRHEVMGARIAGKHYIFVAWLKFPNKDKDEEEKRRRVDTDSTGESGTVGRGSRSTEGI